MTASERKICHAWQQAAAELGFEFTTPFAPHIAGQSFNYLGLVHGFGGPTGTLIGTTAWGTHPQQHSKPDGFFVSLLNPTSYSTFDRKHFVETLDDWGWYGPENKKPSWYTGTPWTA